MIGRFFASILASLSVSMVLAGEYPTKIVGGKPYYEYSVAKSEGFYSISKKFGVTQAEIQEANPQTKNGLKEGEHLLIPKKNTQGVMHKVQKSETLFSLKQKYGLTYDDLYEANPSLKTRGLIEGTNIRIPQKKELVARRNKAEKEASEPVKNTPAPVGSYVLQNLDKVGFYQVAEGNQPTVGANRCYLTVPAAGVKAFFLNGNDATGISNVDANVDANEAIYNIAGQRINKFQKGINIINGKKILK